jgi:hypothetical protein
VTTPVAGMCPTCRQWERVWWGRIQRHKTKNKEGEPHVCLGSGETPVLLR